MARKFELFFFGFTGFARFSKETIIKCPRGKNKGGKRWRKNPKKLSVFTPLGDLVRSKNISLSKALLISNCN